VGGDVGGEGASGDLAHRNRSLDLRAVYQRGNRLLTPVRLECPPPKNDAGISWH
jgi:hypothetical protein